MATQLTPGQFTPGPWTFLDDDGEATIMAGDAGGAVIARVMMATDFPCATDAIVEMLTTECEANGQLLAAAPELLAALQGVLSVADRQTDEFDAARAALAKATGSEAA